jgi:Tfp pilus assembly protein PilV
MHPPMTPLGGRSIDSAQDGFALIEVLISGLIAVLVAGAVMTLFAATERSAADSRNRSQAYALAQEDQARMRTLKIPTLNKYSQTRTVTVDGTNYTVESTAKYINNNTGDDLTCASGSSTVDYAKIASKVTWPRMRSGETASITSLVAPLNGTLDPAKGTLAILATNAAGTPIAGIGVSGSGAGTFSGTTSSSGCLTFLEQTSGEYTLSITGVGTGLVDQDGNTPSTRKIKIAPETTTSVPLLFDKPGSVPVKFTTRNYSGTVITAKAAAFLAYNNNMSTAKLFGAAEGTTFESKTATPLFPFASPDVFYAGACTVNNPGTGPAMASVNVPAGGTAAPQTIRLPALLPTVKKGETAVKEAQVTATDTQCLTGGHGIERTYTTNSSGQIEASLLGLPWSNYDVCASLPIKSGLTTKTYREIKEEVEVHSDTGTPLTFSLSTSDEVGACP